MPVYKITDTKTGRIFKLTGDSPPTEAELLQIFQETEKPTAQVPSIEPSAPSSPDLSAFSKFFIGNKAPGAYGQEPGAPDVYGLVNSPEFKALPTEQRQALINTASNMLRQREESQTKQGTGNIGLALLGMLGGAPTKALAATPPILARGARYGIPLGKRASEAVTRGTAQSPLAESIGLSSEALRHGADKSLSALFAPIKAGGKFIDELARLSGGGLLERGGRLIHAEETAPTIMKIISNPTLQRTLGYYLLTKWLFGGPKEKISPTTGRGIPGKTETEILNTP